MVSTEQSETRETKPSAVAPPVRPGAKVHNLGRLPAWLISLFGLTVSFLVSLFLFSSTAVVPGSAAEKPHSDLKTLRQLANGGNAKAQIDLGLKYEYGDGVPRDYSQAVKWYRKAADQGDDVAQNALGRMYVRGYGVPQDYAEAVKWYRKSADQGNAKAQNYLGLMYARGDGVLQDYAEALRWYRKSADQGNAEAQNNLQDLVAKAPAPSQAPKQPAVAQAPSQTPHPATGAQAGQFPSTNSEIGCSIIQNVAAFRIEQIEHGEAAAKACQQLKIDVGSDIAKCMLGAALMYNRGHGRGDLDELPKRKGYSVLKGCSMLITGNSEEHVDALIKRYSPDLLE